MSSFWLYLLLSVTRKYIYLSTSRWTHNQLCISHCDGQFRNTFIYVKFSSASLQFHSYYHQMILSSCQLLYKSANLRILQTTTTNSLSTQHSRIPFVNPNRLSVNIANTSYCRHINPYAEWTTVINLVHR